MNKPSSAMAALTVILPQNGHQTQQPKAIAPKLKGNNHKASASASPNNEAVTSSTGTKCRRKIAFHPLHGYPIPPPLPAKVARRNARERNRVKQVNCGFEVLRSHIPSAAKQKKMSKVETLKHAVDYIQTLQTMLGDPDQLSGTLLDPNQAYQSSGLDSPTQSIPTTPTSSSSHTHLGHNKDIPPPPPLSMAPPALQQRFTPPTYSGPLTPRTPNTPDQYLNHNFNNGNESGYETSSYYSTGSMVSPVPQVPSNHVMLEYSPNGHSPSTTGSVYSVPDSSLSHQHFPVQEALTPTWQTPIPTSYYENSEEDELLDAIAKWQDQE
ncbi:helix-loop-helix protein 4-like [Tigriopus californicus]|uniref:helix-loop-helix protein 4-like n=1 Tax=Tigriopus californicus TaxID=6832 RepID=UPI0027DA2A9B|nr:helix-loop-helix protein 4-like [Tigriopus californicus]